MKSGGMPTVTVMYELWIQITNKSHKWETVQHKWETSRQINRAQNANHDVNGTLEWDTSRKQLPGRMQSTSEPRSKTNAKQAEDPAQLRVETKPLSQWRTADEWETGCKSLWNKNPSVARIANPNWHRREMREIRSISIQLLHRDLPTHYDWNMAGRQAA